MIDEITERPASPRGRGYRIYTPFNPTFAELYRDMDSNKLLLLMPHRLAGYSASERIAFASDGTATILHGRGGGATGTTPLLQRRGGGVSGFLISSPEFFACHGPWGRPDSQGAWKRIPP